MGALQIYIDGDDDDDGCGSRWHTPSQSQACPSADQHLNPCYRDEPLPAALMQLPAIHNTLSQHPCTNSDNSCTRKCFCSHPVHTIRKSFIHSFICLLSK